MKKYVVLFIFILIANNTCLAECNQPANFSSGYRLDLYDAGEWEKGIRGPGYYQKVKGKFRVLYYQEKICKNKSCHWGTKNLIFLEAWQNFINGSSSSTWVGCMQILDKEATTANQATDFQVSLKENIVTIDMVLWEDDDSGKTIKRTHTLEMNGDFIQAYY
jgi:hypothetical protein